MVLELLRIVFYEFFVGWVGLENFGNTGFLLSLLGTPSPNLFLKF